MFASTDTSLFFSQTARKQTKKAISLESSSHAVLLCDFIRYRLVMKGAASSVCQRVSSNIPAGLFCVLDVCVYVSGRVYLGWVDVVEHHYGCAVVIQHQSPEVLHCVWQRVLGHYEC